MAAKNASPVPPERRAASGSTRLIVKQGAALHQDLRTVRGLVAHPHGYSDTPLPKKLGIKAGTRLAFVRAPDGFDRTVGRFFADAAQDPAVVGIRATLYRVGDRSSKTVRTSPVAASATRKVATL